MVEHIRVAGGGLKLKQYVCTLLVPCSLSHKIRGISRKTKNIKLIKGENYKKKLLVMVKVTVPLFIILMKSEKLGSYCPKP